MTKVDFDWLGVHADKIYLLHKVNDFFGQLSFPYPKKWLYHASALIKVFPPMRFPRPADSRVQGNYRKVRAQREPALHRDGGQDGQGFWGYCGLFNWGRRKRLLRQGNRGQDQQHPENGRGHQKRPVQRHRHLHPEL